MVIEARGGEDEGADRTPLQKGDLVKMLGGHLPQRRSWLGFQYAHWALRAARRATI
jgi:hypothetical protein